MLQLHSPSMAKSIRKQYTPTFIRKWRQHRGLTLEQLASRVDMKASALSMLERGLSGYTQPTLEKIADALNTDAASLIMRDPVKGLGLWSIWEQALPGERRQIEAIAEAVIKSRMAS